MCSHFFFLKDHDGRKPRKTAAFRRICSASDHIVMKQLVSAMDVDTKPPGDQLVELSIDTMPLDDQLPADTKPLGDQLRELPINFTKCDPTDLDETGLPSIFSKFSFYLLPDTDAFPSALGCSTSPAPSPRALSLPDTVLYDSEVDDSIGDDTRAVFDADGFPFCKGTSPVNPPSMNGGGSVVGGDVGFEKPLDPNPKRRKAFVLLARSSPKSAATPMKVATAKVAKATPPKATKAKSTGSSPKKATKPSASPPKLSASDELLLTNPKLTVTAELNPRAQLLATAMCGDQKLRVHVCTANKNSWGVRFASDMEKIKLFIAGGSVTKTQCLVLRDTLKERASAVDLD